MSSAAAKFLAPLTTVFTFPFPSFSLDLSDFSIGSDYDLSAAASDFPPSFAQFCFACSVMDGCSPFRRSV